MDALARAEALVKSTRALADAPLRVAYLSATMQALGLEELARALDVICRRAEQAEEPAREVLLALVDALNAPASRDLLQRLREQAVGESLLSLERLVRNPIVGSPRSHVMPEDPEDDRIPDYGKGRQLTLGERKALARGHNRDMMARLLLDPHPEVIARLLKNPLLTEDDVVRLAAKRPSRSDVLAEIARCVRWIRRPRVRLTIILNPNTPVEIAGPIAGLLVHQELKLVAESSHVSPAVRALCIEYLERRPPTSSPPKGDRSLQ